MLCATLIITSICSGSNFTIADVKANDSMEFPVLEDAYMRAGSNANTNYNYENITKAHGSQYEGKNFKVINVKNSGSEKNEIMNMMKFKLPTKADIVTGQFDKYEFVFNVFKNADFNSGDQTYQYFYTTDTNWDETKVTWNTKPAEAARGAKNLLFEFTIKQGDEFEKKSDEEKQIRIDITDKIEELAAQDINEITVFTIAKDNVNTSLLQHERTSGTTSATVNGDKAAKIVALHEGINLEKLKALITECEALDSSNYSVESFKVLSEELKKANAFVAIQPTDMKEIRAMYTSLMNSKNALVSLGDPNDLANIAFGRPARSNLNKKDVSKVNDGDVSTYWSGVFYPSYVDVDLMDTYDINEILLNFPVGKTIYYTLYGSNDGKNYDEIHRSMSDEPKTKEAEKISFNEACNYRIIRIYIEYTDGDAKSYVSEIKVHGTKQNTNTEELRKGSLEEITNIEAYSDTDYAKAITLDETYENVYGIVDRTVGAEYRDWFTFEIAPNETNDYDYFEISDKNGKIHIKGNEGLSLSTGLNYYYKNFVNVQISEQTMQVNMPEKIVPVKNTVRKETPMSVRYAFNYCTLSYTFAFFGEEEWQKENDWLALNGVNVVLDLAGQEATWIKFLMNFGYSYDDAKDWLVGPGYYAWQFMDNMEAFGGPIPDGYVIDRVELARNTQRWKNSLGMQTVLQGYAGMVPTNFKEFYQGDLEVIKQGSWNGFSRPDMIATDSDQYDEFSELFYNAQEFVYGDTTDYYAVDPFHEGGIRPSGLTDDKIAAEVLESMLKHDSNAVWTVQGWQSNPTDALLNGMGDNREDHVLIVDLIKYPLTSSGEAQYKKNEFKGTSWAWCLLGNFGGNPTMNGELQVMVDDIQQAKKDGKYMVGLGVISEATYDNPIVYDLIFDLAWADETFDLNKWMDGYVERRYGGITDNAKKAWDLMKDANYNLGVRLHPELFGLRTGGVPRNNAKKNVGYEAIDLENALRLLVEDFDKFKDSEAYLYDLTEIMRQVVSNYTLLKNHEVIDARDNKDVEGFKKAKAEFLNAFDVLNEVQATQKEQLAGEWIGKAEDRAASYDDFSNSTFKMNAKSLISTWGSAGGALIDYGFRTYEGMFEDLQKSNWVDYLNQVENNLVDGTPITAPTNSRGYISKYWKWVIDDQDYTRTPKDSPNDLKAISTRVLEECVFTGELDPNIGNIAMDRAIEPKGKNNEGDASIITDGKIENNFVAKTYEEDGKTKNPEFVVDLLAEFDVSKINVVMDHTVEAYYNYELYVSSDKQNWQNVAEKTSEELQTEKGDLFENLSVNGRYIKFIGTKDSLHLDNPKTMEMKVRELRVYGNQMLPTLEQLERLVGTAEKMDVSANSEANITKFKATLKTAQEAVKEQAPPDTVHIVYWDLYNMMIQMDVSGMINVVQKKPVTAHNDPSGNSKNLVDGNKGTKWDSGRLSATGKPYEELITPGWAQIDLQGLYEVTQMEVNFTNNNIWHQYEIYASLDGEDWVKLGEKKTETTPNNNEDTYDMKPQYARYIKMKTTNVQKESPTGKRNSYQVGELIVKGKAVIVDKEELQIIIEAADKKVENEYTKASWNSFVKSLSDAKKVLENDKALPEDVQRAKQTLQKAIDALISITALRDEIAKTEKLDELEYTVDSWKAVNKTLVAMQTVLSKADATQADIDAALSANKEAVSKLKERGDTAPLAQEIKKADDLRQGDYTSESWTVYETALVAAKAAVKDNSNVSEAQVVELLKNLTNAYAGLKKDTAFAKELLKSAIDKAVIAQASEEFKTVVPLIQELVKSTCIRAQAVYANINATNEQCVDAWFALTDALQFLDFITMDKTELLNLINVCKAINTEEYKDGVEVFKAALANAQKVYDNENALAQTIQNAYDELKVAKEALVKYETVDKAVLEAMITNIENKIGDGSKYKQDEAYQALLEALADAKAMAADKDATQADVNSVVNRLADAYVNIRLLPSEEQLVQLQGFISSVNRINRAIFTPAQLKMIDTATTKVNAMIENFNDKEFPALQTEITEVLKMINEVANKNLDKIVTEESNGVSNAAKPNTGDATNMTGIVLLLLLSGCGIVWMQRKRNKKA